MTQYLVPLRDVERELMRGSAAQAAEAPALALRAEGGPSESAGLDEHRRNAEREAVLQALERAGNKRTVAARLLGVSQ